MARLLSSVVAAAALRKEGRQRDALARLESWNGAIPIELGAVLGVEPYYGWLRAELLNQTGHDEEALRWYESRIDLFVTELIYLAPSHLRAAEIYDRQGNRVKSAENYRAFIKLWAAADPDLQPFVTVARERLRRLSH